MRKTRIPLDLSRTHIETEHIWSLQTFRHFQNSEIEKIDAEQQTMELERERRKWEVKARELRTMIRNAQTAPIVPVRDNMFWALTKPLL
jgi:hypothetical protein